MHLASFWCSKKKKKKTYTVFCLFVHAYSTSFKNTLFKDFFSGMFLHSHLMSAVLNMSTLVFSVNETSSDVLSSSPQIFKVVVLDSLILEISFILLGILNTIGCCTCYSWDFIHWFHFRMYLLIQFCSICCTFHSIITQTNQSKTNSHTIKKCKYPFVVELRNVLVSPREIGL